MPRDTDTGLVLEESQFKAKKGGIAVDNVSANRLMAQERGYIILDDPITIQVGVGVHVELVINIHRNSTIDEFNLRKVRRKSSRLLQINPQTNAHHYIEAAPQRVDIIAGFLREPPQTWRHQVLLAGHERY